MTAFDFISFALTWTIGGGSGILIAYLLTYEEESGPKTKPKLKLEGLQKRSRLVRARSRTEASRATVLVSDGEE